MSQPTENATSSSLDLPLLQIQSMFHLNINLLLNQP